MREMKNSGVEWIAEIPRDWEIQRLKVYFDFGKGLPITKADLQESGTAVVSYGQIHAKINNGVHLRPEMVRFVDKAYLETHPASLVPAGSFIVADTSEDLDGVGNAILIEEQEPLFAGYHTIILKNRGHEDNRFLAYLFQTDAWRSQLRTELVEVKLFSVSQRILRATTIVLPSMTEQVEISDYLDTVCADIDAVCADTEEEIALLKAYKQATIAEAVTKGLDPDVEMKDSGVEWIGEIPAHWQVTQLKNACARFGSGTTPPSTHQEYYDDRGIPWITSSDLYQRSTVCATSRGLAESTVTSLPSLQVYEPPFVCVAMYGDHTVGHAALSLIQAATNQSICVLVPSYETDARFLDYSLIAAYKWLDSRALGGKQINLSQTELKSHHIPWPSLEVQKDIADFLDWQCTVTEEQIADLESQLTLLADLKKSLIYDYVTGKAEVPESLKKEGALDAC